MVKLVFCLRRRDDISAEEFHRYWREVHAPLVAKHAAVTGIRRYVQTHAIDAPLLDRGGPAPYDGVAEIWFDSVETMGGTEASRAAGRELFEDEQRFIDHSRSPMFLAHEHVIIGEAEPSSREGA
jgi:uncharacterized protein (TIGR02118 family)